MDSGPVPPLASQKHDVMLSPAAETLLIPLAARAHDAESAAPILGDDFARPTMQRLKYDFDKVRVSPIESTCIAIRTSVFDSWTAAFIQRHPDPTVIHLGCGLDARAQRLSLTSDVMWIDVDFPDVIAMRSKVMQSSFSGFEYRLLGVDICTKDWLETTSRDRATLVVMEGVLSYLSHKDSQGLLQRLATYFNEGEILLDCINSTILSNEKSHPKSVSKIGAKFMSAVDDFKQLEATSQRFKIVESIRFVEAPGIERLPWQARFRMYLVSWIPVWRDSSRLVRLAIGSSATSQNETMKI